MKTKALQTSLIINIMCNLILLGSSEIDVTRYNEGQRQLELLRHQSEMPHYGQCWVDAITSIQTGCRRLTDETQTRLALSYLNCFLELQNLETYKCDSDMDVHECTKPMRDSDRGSFTTFFTHTQNMCYFLQAQVWHEETELTISRLADRSSQVASQLEASHRLQEDMLNSQSQSLKNQEQLIDGTQNLRGIINSSSNVIRTLFEDLKMSTLEQRQIIGDVFDKLINLQRTILGEVSGFYSLFYYILSLLVCYLLTSTSRTSGARLWLFLVMTVNIVVEQTLMRWIAGGGTDDEQLYWLQKQCRRFAVVVGVGVLCVCVYMYQDINELNNQMLVEIRKQNSDIKRFMCGQTDKFPSHESKPSTTSDLESSSDSDYTSDDNQTSRSRLSGDESDHTFILDEKKQQSVDESQSSLDEDTDANKSSLFSELCDLRSATPVREMEGRIHNWLNHSQAGDNEVETPPRHVYNLRSRTSTPSHRTSPALGVESPQSFSRTVRHLQHVSRKNSKLLRAELCQEALSTHNQQQPSSTTPLAVFSLAQSSALLSQRLLPTPVHSVNAAGDSTGVSSTSPFSRRSKVQHDEISVGSRSSRSSRASRREMMK